MARHPPLEILAVEVLHREVGLPLVLAEIVNGDDVRCDSWPAARASRKKRSRSSGFGFDRGGDDLDRDDALEQRVEGAVHDAHAALAELVAQFVAADAFHQEWIVTLTTDLSGVWAEDIVSARRHHDNADRSREARAG